MKFDFFMPVPVNNGGIGGRAVDGVNVYGIAAEQQLLCPFGIKIRFNVTVHLFLRACVFDCMVILYIIVKNSIVYFYKKIIAFIF